ncbi:MAG: RNA polymerase subunit sigma-70, partial [Planctomycetota bacterium]
MTSIARATASAPAPDELVELAGRVRLGDRAAFTALYERFARSVHAVLATRLAADEAEDRVQEVFLKAWRARGELREPGRVGAWLVSIARREAIAGLRARAPADELPETLADARASERGEQGRGE